MSSSVGHEEALDMGGGGFFFQMPIKVVIQPKRVHTFCQSSQESEAGMQVILDQAFGEEVNGLHTISSPLCKCLVTQSHCKVFKTIPQCPNCPTHIIAIFSRSLHIRESTKVAES